MKMPLDGIRILDLSRLLPGPYATMALGDMGADVLKVEDTGAGDYFRTTQYPSYMMLNRNKKSMTLNLKSSEGKEIFLKLAQKYDVILEQFRPGVMQKMGLGYEDIKKVNPGIVYCSLSGYGQYGPYRNLVGHDVNYLGTSGILNAIKQEDGKPVIPGVYLGDLCGGAQWTVIAILTALLGREHNGGLGQYLDVAMSDGLMTLLNLYGSEYLASGRMYNPSENVPWYRVYETKDGKYVTVGAVEPKFWEGFCQLIGRTDFIPIQNDPEHQTRMIKEIADIIITKTQAEWVQVIGDKDICFSPVNEMKEAIADPHNIAREMIVEIDVPGKGKVKNIAYPVKFSETPFKITHIPPEQGEHTEEVLGEFGYSKSDVVKLHEAGVV